MSQIFISYKSTDKERVRPIVELLEGEGWAVWWDRKIPPGKTFDQVIEEALDAASCLVVVWSADSVGSDWVRAEAAEGKKRGILVPVLIDQASIPFEFRRIQAARLTDLPRPVDDPEVQGLLASVARIIESRPNVEAPRTAEQPSPDEKPSTSRTRREGASGTPDSPVSGHERRAVVTGERSGGSVGRWSLRGAVLALPALLVLLASKGALWRPDVRETSSKVSQPGKMTFIGVDVAPEDSQADDKIVDYLRAEASLTFSKALLEYETVVEKLANWDRDDGAILARATPYVYVAAEMLGADLEILATYRSKATQGTTYHSYFVVNRDDFAAPPSLDDVVRFVSTRDERVRFIYHSKFSTSSYFLPSLYFRKHGIFNMERASGSLVAIDSRKIEEESSSELVRRIARGDADLAAVWDGTKAKFEAGAQEEELGKRVYFVRIDTPLPNDLLVCSAFLDSRTKEDIRRAIAEMETDERAWIDIGDFLLWKEWTGAIEAREALAALAWSATNVSTAVTIDISAAETGPRVAESYLEAARQAVRLSGTEFVVYDPDFHQHPDFIWKLEMVHDGALRLTSKVKGLSADELRQQQHWISFADEEELTSRISSFVHTRMDRIRYLWPYADKPTLIRDFAFSLPEGSPVTAQKVAWINPDRNELKQGRDLETRVADSDFNKVTLEDDDFLKEDLRFHADPMSNVAIRVILTRPSRESAALKALTYLFVALLVAAAASAVLDLTRKWKSPVLEGARSRLGRARDVLSGSGIWKRPQAVSGT